MAHSCRLRTSRIGLGHRAQPIRRLHPPAPNSDLAVALILSMFGLGLALRRIPIGTGYAVWVGIGAVGTALAGILLLGESASLLRILSLLLVVAGVVGLKVFH